MIFTYRLDASDCADIGRSFTWGGVDCETVLRLLELGAHAWERHSTELIIRHIDDANSDVPTTFTVQRGDTQGVLAYASSSLIVFSDDECWHAHQDFCRFVADWSMTLGIMYGLVFGTSLLVFLMSLLYECTYPRRATASMLTTIARSTVVMVLSSVAFAVVTGCECRFFGLVAAHEIGHIIGMGHADDDHRNAVMHPTYYERRTSVCPDGNDIELFNATDVVDGAAIHAECIDEGPVLTPAGVMCLILAAGATGYVLTERLVVAGIRASAYTRTLASRTKPTRR